MMKYTYEEIIYNMKKTYEEKAGVSVSKDSDEEKLLEALATELFSLSCYGDFIIKQAFVQSASGEYLDNHGQLRDCIRKEGARAQGELCFSVSQVLENDVVISEGTVCSVPKQPLLQFVTTESVTLTAGELSVSVHAESVDVGRRFNVSQGAVTIMVNAPVGIEKVVNTESFYGGYDGESDTAYRKRIIDMFKIPSVFTSRRETENRIRQVSGVIDCAFIQSENPSTVKLALRSIYGGAPPFLADRISECIGINTFVNSKVEFVPAKEKLVRIFAYVKVKPEADVELVRDYVTYVILEHFSGVRIGESVAVSPMLKDIFFLDDIEKVDFSSEDLKNDIVSCEADKYIALRMPVVTCYE